MRMLMNNLDPEVAERPEDLVVYGGTGRAARSWEAYDAIVRTLRDLGDDETLLVQSGKPVGVFRTHAEAPRVLISNAMLVPKWADWEIFRELEHAGLTMYGQMTAGSWIYIGTQGILQGTYETLAECATQRFGGTLAGTIMLTGGLGGMGGAQPLAVTMNGGVALVRRGRPHAHRAADQDPLPRSGDRRSSTRRSDGSRRPATRGSRSRSGCSGTRGRGARAARARLPARRRDGPDERARSARRVRAGRPLARGGRGAPRARPGGVPAAIVRVDGDARRGDGRVPRRRLRRSSTTGTTSARAPRRVGSVARTTTRASCPRSFARCSARARDRSGGWRSRATRRTSAQTDRAVAELFPDDERLQRWIDMAEERVAFQGLPGPDLLARLRRAREGGTPLQRDGRERRGLGADRDRPRPPRRRQRRVPVPGDRGR